MARAYIHASVSLIVLCLAGALAVAGAPKQVPRGETGEPDSMADKQCTSPSNLTGPVTIADPGINSAVVVPSILWDGAAYAVAWGGVSDVGFARYAADGTPLVPATTISTVGSQRVSLAWTGAEYAVTWDTGVVIRFCRIGASGAKLGGDVDVDSGTGTQQDATLVWTGSQFGVAWEDSRGGDFDVFFNRLSPQGVVLQPGADTRVNDTPLTSAQLDPSLAWTGSEFGVAWDDTRDGVTTEIYMTRISSSGGKVATDFRITADPAASDDPSLVWNGLAYGLAWSDARTTVSDVYLALLSSTLSTLAGPVQLTSNGSSATGPSIAWTGAEFGVLWLDGGTADLFLSRASSAGAVLTTTQITDEVYAVRAPLDRALAFGTLGYGAAHALNFASAPFERFVGIGCRADTTPPTCPTGLTVTGNSSAGVTLAWASPGADPETELAYHRVYRDGAAIGITTATSYTDSPRPAGTPLYTVVAVNAAGRESTGCAVVSAPLPTGNCGQDLTGSQVVSVSSAFADRASIAWTGSFYGVAWQDDRDLAAFPEIYFRRVTTGGTTLGPDVRVTTNPATSQAPSLAWTGSEFGVAWLDNRDAAQEIYFARLTADGVKIGADIRITNDLQFAGNPSLVWTGTEYGLAWDDNQFFNYEILFARISSAGSKIGGDVRLTTDAADSQAPSLVFTGTEYGVAWHDTRPGNYEIYFTRVSSDGTEIGSDVRITNDPATSGGPSLAYSGTSYGVSFEEQRDGNQEVYFARISTAGVKLGGDVRITFGASSSYPMCLAWTGSEYGLVWDDDRMGNPNYDVYYCLVGDNGVKSGPDTRLTFSPTLDLSQGLAVGGRGLGLVYVQNGAADQVRFIGLGCGAPDTTPPSCPSAPQELSRTPGNPGTLTLGWGPSIDPESDLSHYRVFKDGSEIANTLALTYTDTNFNPAAGPTYWVDAVNAAWLVSPGCASVDTSDAVPPTCPTNLIATNVTTTSCTLSWVASTDNLAGVRRYNVYKNNVLELSVNHPTTTTPITGLTAGTTYNFAVVAEDWAGNTSAACATATVWISTSPITLYLTKNPNGIDAHLDWNDVGLNEYVVFRSTSPQWASEHARVPVSEDEDPVLQDGVQIWFYYIQQRGL